jgi:hypothetical protein
MAMEFQKGVIKFLDPKKTNLVPTKEVQTVAGPLIYLVHTILERNFCLALLQRLGHK